MEIHISPSTAAGLKRLNDMVQNKTDLPFLLEHSGLRNSKLHTILSSTGAGKSTLIRTILLDFLKLNEGKVLLWLSEETISDFRTSASYMSDVEELSGRVVVFSEIDYRNEDDGELLKGLSKKHNHYLDLFKKKIAEGYSLIIFDNATTSDLYTENIITQVDMANEIKRASSKCPCPIIVVAHTAKNEKIKKLIFDADSIRGSAKITQISEYIYCLQTIQTDTGRKSFLIIEKSRNHAIKNKLYILIYDEEQKIYNKSKICELSLLQDCARGKNGI